MNLIITPVYKAFERAKQMVEAIDNNATLPFYHVMVADNCGDIPIEHSKNRAIITFRDDHIPGEHKSKEGQALDLAYQYGTQKYTPYGPKPGIDYVFLIEEDVMVTPGWDAKQIDLSTKLKDWASLDVNSVDEEGRITYPTTISPRYEYVEFDGSTFEHQHYADFQCTLFNPGVWETGIRFSDFPDHFDILWSRKITEVTGLKHYRTPEIKLVHYPESSRSLL